LSLDLRVEHLLRDLAPQVLGATVRRFRDFAASEDAVQEALIAAAAQWPRDGVPENPHGWLTRTATNRLLDQLRSDARHDIAVQKMIDAEIAQKIPVKPEQLTDFYTKNPDQFKQPERVHASHILIGVPRGADAAAKAQAQAKAEQVLKDVKAGKDFAALAKEHSQDPGSAPNGGDLGFFQQGQMVGPFNDAAFSLAPGAVSDLVETEFGFHIIKVTEKQTARTVPLDEVKPRLEQFLLQRNRQEQTDAFIKGLRSKGTIELLI